MKDPVRLKFSGPIPNPTIDITTASTQWTLIDENDKTWTLQTFKNPSTGFYTIARPVKMVARSGYTWIFEYASDDTLSKITDSFGRDFSFTWNKFDPNRILGASFTPDQISPYGISVNSIKLPDGAVLRFTYTPGSSSIQAGELFANTLVNVQKVSITSPAGSGTPITTILDTTTYAHDDPRFPTYITSITDARGVVTNKVTYDGYGRALTSELANGDSRVTASYVANDFTGGPTVSHAITNALGKQTIYTFDFNGTLEFSNLIGTTGVASSNCPASATSITRDPKSHYIVSSTDEEGRITQYVRDADNRPTTIREAFGTADERAVSIAWHPTFNVPTRIVEPNKTTNYVWTNGQLTSISEIDTTTQSSPYPTNGQSRTWAFTYGTGGLLTSVDGPLAGTSDTIKYTYNAQGNLATITNEVGHLTTINTWNGLGAPLTATDPNGTPMSYVYDQVGRLTQLTVGSGATSSTWTMTYDQIGQVTKITRPSGSFLSFTWSGSKRLVSVANALGETITYTRDALGDVTRQTITGADGSIAFQTAGTFDELGRLIRMVGGAGRTWKTAYDKTSNPVTFTDPRNGVNAIAYDGLSRVKTATAPDSGVVTLTRSAQDDVTVYKDPRNLTTTFIRNGFGDVIQETSPDAGATIYEYDLRGLRTKRTEARGIITTYTYDAAGRLLTKSFPAASAENVSITWDDTTAGNQGKGHITRISDQSGVTAWTWDALGRLIGEKKTIGAYTYNVGYAWDTSNRLTAMSYPSGRLVYYGYDTADRPSSIGVQLTPTTFKSLVDWVGYLPMGGVKDMVYSAGIGQWQGFDQEYRLNAVGIQNLTSGAMLSQRLIQSYDGLNLNGIVDQLVPANSEYFGYDSVGRLTGASGPFGGLQWTYDLNGNRTAEIVGTAAPYVTHGYSVPSTSNKLSTVTSGSATERSLTYDAAGNLTQDSRGTTPYAFTYNKAGRPAALTIGTAARASYVYDALERLTIRTLTNGTPNLSSHLIYDRAGHLLAETNGAGVTLRDYIWLGDRPTGVIDSTNPAAPKLYQVHTDHIGRPFLMTDASKAVVWEAHYKPFGEVWSISGSASLDARFPGQWFQLEDGLLYNWYRQYDPTLGRYTQVDPLSALVTGPDRYGYAGASPQMNVDPDGRKLKYDHQVCVALRAKIQRYQYSIDRRELDLLNNPLNLPERIGPGERLSETIRGHRTMIQSDRNNMRKAEDAYDRQCENEPPSGGSPLGTAGICIGTAAVVGCLVAPEICAPGAAIGGLSLGVQ